MWGTIIDVVLIAIVVISAIIGIVKGLFDSVLGLVGTALAGIAGVFLAKYVAPVVNNIFGLENFFLERLDGGNDGAVNIFGAKLDNVEVAKFAVWIITVIAIFLVLKLVIFILGKVFESVTKSSPAISGINRVLGMVFGIAKGAVSAALLIAIASLLGKIPVIGTTIDDKIAETKICKWADKYIDEFIENNLTQEKIQDIVDSIVSENTPDDSDNEDDTSTGETTEGNNAVTTTMKN